MSFIGGFLSESILAVSGFVLMSFGFNELRKRNIIPFPKHGLTLKAILKFIERNGGRERFQGLTTTQVCEDVLKIITSKRQCSYCDLLLFEEEKEEEDGDAVVDDGVADKKLKSVGKAGVFISHAWKYNFLDVVSALENHFKDTPETIIWFDLFSNNQHLAISLPFEWWATSFKSAIQEMGRTVMVLAPWRDPIPFTRAWCLFEIYSTVITESHFEVAMSESEKDKFLDEICIDNGAFYKMLGDVDVRKSEAWNPKDKARIFEVAEKEVGFPKLNAMVSEKMRSWVSLTLKNSVSAPGLSKEDELKRKMGYANNLEDTAHFDEALPLYQECFDGYIALHGSENHVDVARACNSIGHMYYHQGQYDTALKIHEKALAIYIVQLEADHPDMATTYNYMGDVNLQQGHYDSALKMYEKALAIRIAKLGADHLDLAISYMGLARTHTRLNQYDTALEMHEKCVSVQIAKLGADHPSLSHSYSNMANVYYRLHQYDSALKMHEKNIEIQTAKLGTDGPGMAYAYHGMANVYNSQGQYDSALKMYEKCVANRIANLGADHPHVASTYFETANVYNNLCQYDAALKMHEKALAIRIAKLEADHPHVAGSYHGMGNVHNNLCQYDSALKMYEKALAIRIAKLAADHPDVQKVEKCISEVKTKI